VTTGGSWLLAVVMLAGCGWLQYCIHLSDNDGKRQVAALKADIADRKKLNEEMKIRNDEMRTSLFELKNNPEYVEELARQWLFMIKPNEIYVMPVEEADPY